MKNKSVQLKMKLDNLINSKNGLSDEEKLALKNRIIKRIRKNANKPINLFIDRKLYVYLEIEYMYGGMYRIFLCDGKTKKPLNIYSNLVDVIEIASREKKNYLKGGIV